MQMQIHQPTMDLREVGQMTVNNSLNCCKKTTCDASNGFPEERFSTPKPITSKSIHYVVHVTQTDN